jgi:hypothetical protein
VVARASPYATALRPQQESRKELTWLFLWFLFEKKDMQYRFSL